MTPEELFKDDHFHTGLDSPRIDFNDLKGIKDYKVTFATTTISDGTVSITAFATGIARAGDYVISASEQNLSGAVAVGYVSGSGTTSIVINNETGSTVTINRGTWRIKVIKI